MIDYDYTVRDSSIMPNTNSMMASLTEDTAIRIGIVREHKEDRSGSTYTVEVLVDGKYILVGCKSMVRFGGVHNFEEYHCRPWLSTTAALLAPAASDKYKARSGDVVVIAYLGGNSREGVILGGLNHDARKPKLKVGNVAYLSEFNGVETSITNDGSYKVTYKGYTPADEAILKAPPSGQDILAPKYNPITGGSYFGFNDKGSFIASDGKQAIKINKELIGGSIILKSGSSYIELGGKLMGTFGVVSGKVAIEAKGLVATTSIKSGAALSIESLQVSIKGKQIAIGNDQFELFDGLGKLIDALGEVVVTSPVGTCTPLMASPQWASKVLPLKRSLALVKGSLKTPDSFELSGNDEIAIKGNE